MLKISFEFVGGPNDGKALHGSLGDASDAERYYLFTNHGNIGQRFKVASDFAVEALAQEYSGEAEPQHSYRTHYYIVKERLEEGQEVLVRAEYVEKESAETNSHPLLQGPFKSGPVEVESNEDKIRRYLKQAATVMDQSYGHYWPADQPDGSGVTEQNVLLHFAYVMLNERFSVFAKAQHPNDTVADVDLLGVSPGQDWFLACQFMRLNGSEQLSEMSKSLQQLNTYWLNARLTIEACRKHIDQVARHCEEGYGLVAGLHWVSEDAPATELLDLWTSKDNRSRLAQFAGQCEDLEPRFFAPISIRHYEGLGRYCLLPICLRIPNQTE